MLYPTPSYLVLNSRMCMDPPVINDEKLKCSLPSSLAVQKISKVVYILYETLEYCMIILWHHRGSGGSDTVKHFIILIIISNHQT